ncbi:hypothetical protein AN958_01792 [Leucoagaricus sp. SymC.cos]|nr:hypothetical protein AN958_01792 [Leucoagaricus sp. SymC.cos]
MYDTMVLCFILWKTAPQYNSPLGPSSIHRQMMQDGLLYYCPILLVTLVLSLMITFAPDGEQNLTAHKADWYSSVEYIWQRRLGPVTYLFLVNRYLIPLGFIVNLLAYLSPLWTPEVRWHGTNEAIARLMRRCLGVRYGVIRSSKILVLLLTGLEAVTGSFGMKAP